MCSIIIPTNDNVAAVYAEMHGDEVVLLQWH